MNRFAKFAFAGVVAVLASASAEAQQKGPTNQGQQGPPGAYHGGIGQTPWFSNPEIRQQFKLNDTQFNDLNKSYGEAYGKYQQGTKAFGKDLTPEQRNQKMAELHQGFHKDFSTSVGKVFTDPQQQQRYNELNLQYQGYNAFSNPMVQEKLQLTPEQRQQLARQGQDWNKKMEGLGQTYQNDPKGATKQYNDMRNMYGQQLNTVLTPEQQKSWQQMTGKTYNFSPSVYFQTSSGTGTTSGGKENSPAPK
jgi:hypothetical protein